MTRILKSFSRSDGYSFIEIFIVLIIVSLLSSLLLVNGNKITGIINKGRHELNVKYDLIKLREILGNEAKNVTPPWFLKTLPIEIEKDEIKISYYNGDKEDFLIIIKNEKGISVRNNDDILYSSSILNGKFTVTNSYITYTQDKYNFIFSFGVFLA